MAAPTYVALDRASALLALEGLAASPADDAVWAYGEILRALSESVNGGRSIRLPITDRMYALLRSVHVRPGLVSSVRQPRYVAVYRHPEDPSVPDITVHTYDRPRNRRTLNGPGGRRRYIRLSLTKEEHPMAARTTRTRAKSRKAVEPDELDDLEALEELEDLDDVEEDAPAKPKRRATRKAKPAPEPEDDDDDDLEDEDDEEDEEEDEDDEPAPRKRTGRRTAKPAAKPAAKSTATRGTKTAAKTTAKRTPPAPRELPKGKLSVNDIAEQAGTSGANVRQWLRRNDWPKDDELGRYVFSAKDVKSIVKQMNA